MQLISMERNYIIKANLFTAMPLILSDDVQLPSIESGGALRVNERDDEECLSSDCLRFDGMILISSRL